MGRSFRRHSHRVVFKRWI